MPGVAQKANLAPNCPAAGAPALAAVCGKKCPGQGLQLASATCGAGSALALARVPGNCTTTHCISLGFTRAKEREVQLRTPAHL